jgi:hypothetical protein
MPFKTLCGASSDKKPLFAFKQAAARINRAAEKVRI